MVVTGLAVLKANVVKGWRKYIVLIIGLRLPLRDKLVQTP